MIEIIAALAFVWSIALTSVVSRQRYQIDRLERRLKKTFVLACIDEWCRANFIEDDVIPYDRLDELRAWLRQNAERVAQETGWNP